MQIPSIEICIPTVLESAKFPNKFKFVSIENWKRYWYVVQYWKWYFWWSFQIPNLWTEEFSSDRTGLKSWKKSVSNIIIFCVWRYRVVHQVCPLSHILRHKTKNTQHNFGQFTWVRSIRHKSKKRFRWPYFNPWPIAAGRFPDGLDRSGRYIKGHNMFSKRFGRFFGRKFVIGHLTGH